MFNPYYSGLQNGRGSMYSMNPFLNPMSVSLMSAERKRSLSPRRLLKSIELDTLKEEIREGFSTELRIPSNRFLTNDQCIDIIREVCASKSNITRLDLSNCQLNDKAITPEVILLLTRNTRLTSINFSCNNFTQLTESIFVSILKANYYVTFFSFYSSKVSKKMSDLANTYLIRNKEIEQTIQKSQYYYELLKQVRCYLKTGIDTIVLEYSLENTSKEATEFIFEYYFPYLQNRIIMSGEEIEAASKAPIAKLSTLSQAFQSKQDDFKEITPILLIKFHQEKVKRHPFLQASPKPPQICSIL